MHRSTKTLVAVTGPDGQVRPSSASQGRSGRRAEIGRLADPGSVPEGSDLPVRVYLPGLGPGAVLIATHLVEDGPLLRIPIRPGGVADLPIRGPGTWPLEVHSARRLPAVDVRLEPGRGRILVGTQNQGAWLSAY